MGVAVTILVVLASVFQIGPFHRVAKAEDAAKLSAEGWQLWRQRKLTEAEKKFQEAIKIDSEDANIWNGLGWSQINQRKLDEALKSFKAALELDDEHPAALNGVGQVYLAQRKFGKAKKWFQKASKSAPAALYGLIRIQLLEEDFDSAAKTLALLKKGDDSANIKSKIEQFERAIATKTVSNKLREAIEPPDLTKSKDETALKLNASGWQHFFSQKFRPAEVAFREALKLKPDFDAAKNGLGFCLLNQGKPKEAKPIFEELVKKEPEHAGFVNGLARCYSQTGDLEQAVKIWQTVDDDSEPANDLTSGLGSALHKLGRYKEALTYLKRVDKAFPNNEIVLRKIRECEEKIASGE